MVEMRYFTSRIKMSWVIFLIAAVCALTTVQSANVSERATPTISTDKYHNYKDLQALLRRLVSNYPNLARVYHIGESVGGRNLSVIQISDRVNVREVGEPRFKYIGNIHGNEAVGREVILYLAQYLLYNYGTDPRVTQLVDTTDIHLMPTMNPDGFEISREGDCDSILGRSNKNGLDLNRNFPALRWKNSIIQPETQAVMDWIKSQPNFVLSATLHGGSLVANYPFDDHKYQLITPSYVYSASPDDNTFKSLARSYANAHPTMNRGKQCNGEYDFPGGITNGAYWYSIKGGMQDYNYLHSNTFDITLEISCCKYPSRRNLTSLWNVNRDALLTYIEQTHMGVKGVIKTSKGAPITNAQVRVSGINHVMTTSDLGEYWRLLIPGTYNITYSVARYKSAKTQVTVRPGSPVVLNVTFDTSTKHGTVNEV
ncbi:carboxypeptidase D-like isoform X3 [Physella acuta]|uniref:carboxypeptidase D-like isoform X3 n=1 Tax=Physella acuta TaxID=109671 RepID=UPI0027DC9425|nr:carboxypeptidase D-like isoform X3 [Physella acuta]